MLTYFDVSAELERGLLVAIELTDAKPEGFSVWPVTPTRRHIRFKPIDGGKALEVRGDIGPFFRNQRWSRVG